MQHSQWKCITAFTTSPLVNKHAAWPCLTQQDSFPQMILLVLLKLNLQTHHSFPAEWGHISNYLFNSQTLLLDSASHTHVYTKAIHAVISLAILVRAKSLQQSVPCGFVNACRLVHDRMWISWTSKWQENKHSHSFRPGPIPQLYQAGRPMGAPGWSSVGDETSVICLSENGVKESV